MQERSANFTSAHKASRSDRRFATFMASSRACQPIPGNRINCSLRTVMEERDESLRKRVLILTPVGRDGDLARSVLLQDNLAAEICTGVDDLCKKLAEGAGAAVIADEGLNAVNLPLLSDWVKAQPAWSDFPFIILTAGRTLHAAI